MPFTREQAVNDGAVALVFDNEDVIVDYTYNWETAQNIALSSGNRVEAVRDDGSMTCKEIQTLCDAERERHNDCFGKE